MKVDNPRFNTAQNKVLCTDCPFADEDGWATNINSPCGKTACPSDMKTYAEACEFAQKEAR